MIQMMKKKKTSPLHVPVTSPTSGACGRSSSGLLLYNKMCKVKMTSKASADSHKVATLAAASVVCFSVHAFLALFFDNSFIIIWNLEHVESQLSAPLILLYYLTGEAIPSLVVLWVMRDMPSQLQDPSLSCHPMQDNLIENGLEQALIPDTGLVPQWVSSPSGQQYLVFLGQPSNHISPQESKQELVEILEHYKEPRGSRHQNQGVLSKTKVTNPQNFEGDHSPA